MTAACVRTTIFLLLCCVLPGIAQERVVTLLPSSTSPEMRVADPKRDPKSPQPAQTAYLYFKVPPYVIPTEAMIKKVELRLVRDGVQADGDMYFLIQSVQWDTAAQKPATGKPVAVVGNIEAAAGSAEDTGELTQNKEMIVRTEGSNRYIGLQLASTAKEGGLGSASARSYASMGAAEASKVPRLIVTYEMPPGAAVPEWSNAEAPGVQGPPGDFMTQPPETEFSVMNLFANAASKSYTGTPVSYGGLLWLIPDGKRLVASRPTGGFIGSGITLPVNIGEGAQMVVNPSGRLTVVTKNTMMVFQLNAQEPDRSTPLSQIPQLSYPNLTLKLGSVIAGTDGAIYAATGREILALNPELAVLWKGAIDDPDNGVRMTMSPGGRFLYVADRTGLKVFNAQTGAVWQPGGSRAASFVHTPAVTRRTTSSGAQEDWILVAGNTGSSGWLREVINSPARDKPGTARLLPTGTGKNQDGWEKTGAFFSRPVLDAASTGDSSKRLLYVVTAGSDKKLAMKAIRLDNGGVEHAWSEGTAGDATYLWRGGGPVLDARGNVFFWNDATLYGLDATASKLFSIAPGSLTVDTDLVFGPDGSLLASDAATGTTSVVIPRFQLGANSPLRICGTAGLWLTGSPSGDLVARANSMVVLNDLKTKPGSSFRIDVPGGCQ